MKYYVHKTTNEPLILLSNSMVDVCLGDTTIEYPHISSRLCCANLCIFPERQMGNGIPFHAIPFPELKKFKRINREKFIEQFPDHGQYRHFNDKTMQHFILEKIPIRKKTFGI